MIKTLWYVQLFMLYHAMKNQVKIMWLKILRSFTLSMSTLRPIPCENYNSSKIRPAFVKIGGYMQFHLLYKLAEKIGTSGEFTPAPPPPPPKVRTAGEPEPVGMHNSSLRKIYPQTLNISKIRSNPLQEPFNSKITSKHRSSNSPFIRPHSKPF